MTQSGLSPGLRYGDVVRVDLVGHSMGGIVINEILHEFPCLKVDNLVYLASAASLDHFDKTALPYLEGPVGGQTRVYFVGLHPINESTEDLYWYFPFIPRGSLLHWIDTMYEPSSRVLAKTMGSWVNIMRYRSLLAPQVQSGRMVFKTFGFDPDLPQRHTDLNDVICRQRAKSCTAAEIAYTYWRPASWSAEPLVEPARPCIDLGTGAPLPAERCAARPPPVPPALAPPPSTGVEQPPASS